MTTEIIHKFLMDCSNHCYQTNNRFAYKFDVSNSIPDDELKTDNFVPTYDKWCLYCDNKSARFKCSRCKFVYFCSKSCQKKSWKIHKKHCGRDLFILCIYCGSENPTIKCEKEGCKVKYCSLKCKNEIHRAHLDCDCDNFIRLSKSSGSL